MTLKDNVVRIGNQKFGIAECELKGATNSAFSGGSSDLLWSIDISCESLRVDGELLSPKIQFVFDGLSPKNWQEFRLRQDTGGALTGSIYLNYHDDLYGKIGLSHVEQSRFEIRFSGLTAEERKEVEFTANAVFIGVLVRCKSNDTLLTAREAIQGKMDLQNLRQSELKMDRLVDNVWHGKCWFRPAC